MTHVPERRKGGDRRSTRLRASDQERIDRLVAALDFSKSTIEACRDGIHVAPENAEAVLRIIERAKVGLWTGRELLQEREHAVNELRRCMRAAWQQRAANVSIPEVLDRLIAVARGSHHGE
jgi:hypothetical protein